MYKYQNNNVFSALRDCWILVLCKSALLISVCIPVVAFSDHLSESTYPHNGPLVNYSERLPTELAPLLASVPSDGASFFDSYEKPLVLGRFVGLDLMTLSQQNWRSLSQHGVIPEYPAEHITGLQNLTTDLLGVRQLPSPPPALQGLQLSRQRVTAVNDLGLANLYPDSYSQRAFYQVHYYHYDFKQHYQQVFGSYQVPSVEFGAVLMVQPDIHRELSESLALVKPTIKERREQFLIDQSMLGDDIDSRNAYALEVDWVEVDLDSLNGADVLWAEVIPKDESGEEINAVYSRGRELIVAVRYQGQWWMTHYANYCGQTIENCGW